MASEKMTPLRRRRERSPESLSRMESLHGVSRGTLHKAEAGRHCGTRTLFKLATAYEVPVLTIFREWLRGHEEMMESLAAKDGRKKN